MRQALRQRIDPVDWPINAIFLGPRDQAEELGLVLVEALSGELRVIHFPPRKNNLLSSNLLFVSDDRHRVTLRQMAHRSGLMYKTSTYFHTEISEPFLLSQVTTQAPTTIPRGPFLHERKPGPSWFVCVDTADALVYHALPHLPRVFYRTANAGLTYFRVDVTPRKGTCYVDHTPLRYYGISTRKALGLPHAQQVPALRDDR